MTKLTDPLFATLLAGLPLRQRLALTYAPRQTHTALLALLALDKRLAGILRNSREPMMAQLRLAWWREQLGTDSASWPEGEPLLAALRGWNGRHASLVALVDGWEALTGDAPLPGSAFEQLAEGRGLAFAALAGNERAAATALRMGRGWALADLAAHLGNDEERRAAHTLAAAQDWRPGRLPRELRTLAVLHALASAGLRGTGNRDKVPLNALLSAMRVGILGR